MLTHRDDAPQTRATPPPRMGSARGEPPAPFLAPLTSGGREVPSGRMRSALPG